MTAPAAVPESADMGALLDSLAHDAALASLPTDQAAEEASHATRVTPDQPRADNGRFTVVPKPEDATDDADAETETAVTDALATVIPPAEAAPEGEPVEGDATEEVPASPFAALPVIESPMVPFAVKVGDTALEKPPAMDVTFTVHGKERTYPLDKVVRLAQDGVHQEAREQKYRGIEAEATTLREKTAAYEQALADAQAYVDALLSDDVRYLQEADGFRAQNTPEKRAERLEAQLREEREAVQRSRIVEQGEKYFTGVLTPALDKIAEALPMVAPEELVAKLSLYLPSVHGGRGYLTPEEYAKVSEYVVESMVPWAKDLHESRAARFAPKAEVAKVVAKATDATKKAETAQVAAQQSKNKVANALKPVGKAGPSAPPKKAPATTVDGIMDDAVADAVRSVLGG